MTGNPTVAIVDYGLGNLFSIRQACTVAELDGITTHDPACIEAADAVILPGIGAFGMAMERLNELGLVTALRDIVATGKPVLGICLGMQLLFEESTEFGGHKGLGLIGGDVVRLPSPSNTAAARRHKVPQIGWNRIGPADAGNAGRWHETLLRGVASASDMYFVHSYYVRPSDPSVVLALTTYAGISYCSVLQKDNLFACQFHPERSGEEGLKLYRNLAALVRAPKRAA